MNKAESEALEIELCQNGWESAESPEESSLVIINTCSVRKTAEDRIWGRIGFYKRIRGINPDQRLIVTGCMAERLGDELKNGNNSPVDKVFGTFEKAEIVNYVLERNIAEKNENNIYVFKEKHTKNGSFKAFIPIMNGCNNFCSYCIVPYVRGREISRNPDEIILELKELEEMKIKEISLIGQNVNSYNYNNGNVIMDFPDLLSLITRNVKSVEWIRFITSHPKDLSDKLIETISKTKSICKHLHLPLQSGSDKILDRMNRKYTSGHYYDLVDKIKKAVPGISITTDIIVGFPGEQEEDFDKTCEMMEKVRFNDAFTYYYNPRLGTKAFSYKDDVEKDLKLQRLSKIIKLQRKITSENKKEKIGKTVRVLAEDYSKNSISELIGRTESDEMIVFPGKHDKIGLLHDVKIISMEGNTFKGELINK